MVLFTNIESFGEILNDRLCDYKIFYNNLRSLKGRNVNLSLIQKSQDYLNNEYSRIERVKKVYDKFSSVFNQICENYLNEVNSIEEEEKNEVEGLKNDFEDMKNELKMKNEKLKNKSMNKESESSFIYKKSLKSKMNLELVLKYPGSYMYTKYMEGALTNDGDVHIDIDGENDEYIVKYMNDDESLEEDIKQMNSEKKEKLLSDLNTLELPIKMIFIKQLCVNEDNEIMEAWREKRVWKVNNKYNKDFINLLKKNHLLDTVFKNQNLGNIQYIEHQKSVILSITLKFYNVIVDCLKNEKMINKKLIEDNSDNGDADELINEMRMMGIELNDEMKEEIRGCFDHSLFVNISNIIDNDEYDKYLQKWTRCHKWKLIYTASKYGYTAKSFHEFCDNAKPTLVIIKSDEGYIFGGYTTQTWNGSIYYYDNMMIINR